MLSGASDQTCQVNFMKVLRWKEEGIDTANIVSLLDMLWGRKARTWYYLCSKLT